MPDIREVDGVFVDYEKLSPEMRAKVDAVQGRAAPPPPPQPALDPVSAQIQASYAQADAQAAAEAQAARQWQERATQQQQPANNPLLNVGVPMGQQAAPPPLQVAPMGAPQVDPDQPQMQAQGQAQPPVPPVQADEPPTVMHVRQAGGRPRGPSATQKGMLDAVGAEGQAKADQEIAKAEGSDRLGAIYNQTEEAIKQRQQEIDDRKAVAELQYEETIARHEKALEDVRNQKVEGGFANGGEAFLAVLGMLMSHGGGPMLGLLEKNIKVQQENIDRKKEYVAGLKVTSDMRKKMMDDLEEQKSIAASQILEGAKLQLQEVASRTDNKEFKAKAEEQIANFAQRQLALADNIAKKNAAAAASRQRHFIDTPGGKMEITDKQAFDLEKGRITHGQKLEEEKVKADAKTKAERKVYTIPGLEGATDNVNAYNKAIETKNALDGFREHVNEWRKLEQSYASTGKFSATERTKMTSLYEKMINAFAKVETGGVVTESDKRGARLVIPNPKDWIGAPETMNQLMDLTQRIAYKQIGNAGYKAPGGSFTPR